MVQRIHRWAFHIWGIKMQIGIDMEKNHSKRSQSENQIKPLEKQIGRKATA